MLQMFKCENGDLFDLALVKMVQKTNGPDFWVYLDLDGKGKVTRILISQNDYERFVKLASDKVMNISII